MKLSEEAEREARQAGAMLRAGGILGLMNYDAADPKNAPILKPANLDKCQGR